MKNMELAGGIIKAVKTKDGDLRYYLIRSILWEGEESCPCYSLFCESAKGAAFYFDLWRQEEQALFFLKLLAKGEVSPFHLEEVLEEQ